MRQFWNAVAKDLEKQKGLAPKDWKENVITEFLVEFETKLRKIFQTDEKKVENCNHRLVTISEIFKYWKTASDRSLDPARIRELNQDTTTIFNSFLRDCSPLNGLSLSSVEQILSAACSVLLELHLRQSPR